MPYSSSSASASSSSSSSSWFNNRNHDPQDVFDPNENSNQISPIDELFDLDFDFDNNEQIQTAETTAGNGNNNDNDDDNELLQLANIPEYPDTPDPNPDPDPAHHHHHTAVNESNYTNTNTNTNTSTNNKLIAMQKMRESSFAGTGTVGPLLLSPADEVNNNNNNDKVLFASSRVIVSSSASVSASASASASVAATNKAITTSNKSEQKNVNNNYFNINKYHFSPSSEKRAEIISRSNTNNNNEQQEEIKAVNKTTATSNDTNDTNDDTNETSTLLSTQKTKIKGEEVEEEVEVEEMTQMMFDLWGSKETQKNAMPSDETSNTLAIEVDKVWAKELYEMKHPEREAITNEIHGVKSRSVQETTELIEKSLLAMEYQLSKSSSSTSSSSASTDMDKFIVASSTSSSNIIEEEASRRKADKEKDNDNTNTNTNTNSSNNNNNNNNNNMTDELKRGHIYATTVLKSNYVTSLEFRLKFLRCEFFDIVKACIRYCKNLNFVYELFGNVALLRPLRLNDLSQREIKHLKGGQSQILSVRDKMGRRMFVGTNLFDYEKQITIQEFSRVTVYLAFGIMADDETTAKKGAINVNFFALNSKSMTISWDIQFKNRKEFYQKLTESVPTRYTAIHVNMPDTQLYHFLKAIMLSMIPSTYRAITRIHTGSTLECNYSMCSFGIPIQDMCITPSGKTKNKAFLQTLKARNAIDEYRKERCRILNVNYVTQEMEKNFSMEQLQLLKDSNIPRICPGTECPDMNCIILGDRRMYKRSANIEFRYFLQLKRQREDAKERPRNLDIDFLDEIIDEAYSLKGYKFVAYDKKFSWYANINASWCDRGNYDESHRIELRKKISQLMRDERKRTLKAPSSSSSSSSSSLPAAATTTSKRNITYDDVDKGNNSLFGIDPKRFKPDCFSSYLNYNDAHARDI